MIKYFHELTKDEFKKLVDSKITYKQLANDYPQPVWCGYPDAIQGQMGCWSLMMIDGRINRKFCRTCSEYIKLKSKEL